MIIQFKCLVKKITKEMDSLSLYSKGMEKRVIKDTKDLKLKAETCGSKAQI